MIRNIESYHHGDLRRVVLDAAVAQVAVSGASHLSLREIARRAGVSHAAPGYHFGDKSGLFTAIAVEGYQLLTERTGPLAGREDGLLEAGIAYVRFAIEHPGHFEVMFRPELQRRDDPDLAQARDASFAVLYLCARHGTHAADDADVSALVVAAWSAVHGFATLWLTANLGDHIGDDLDAAVAPLAAGFAVLGKVIEEQSARRR
jgi:AcrR family transcriptional regulator